MGAAVFTSCPIASVIRPRPPRRHCRYLRQLFCRRLVGKIVLSGSTVTSIMSGPRRRHIHPVEAAARCPLACRGSLDYFVPRFTSNSIAVNAAGLFVTDGVKEILDITTSGPVSTPEPSTHWPSRPRSGKFGPRNLSPPADLLKLSLSPAVNVLNPNMRLRGCEARGRGVVSVKWGARADAGP